MPSFDALRNSLLWIFTKKCPKLCPSAHPTGYLDWIISKSNPSIEKILFVLGSYGFLEKLEGRIKSVYSFRPTFPKITMCCISLFRLHAPKATFMQNFSQVLL